MAKRSTTELSTQIQSLAAVHDETAYKNILDDEINESTVKKKGEIGTVGTSGALSVSYESDDIYGISTTGNISITFSGMVNGQRGLLFITKGSLAHTITFVNGTYYGFSADSLTDKLVIRLEVIYYLGVFYVVPFGTENLLDASTARKGLLETATNTEAQAKSETDKAIVPSNLAALSASETFAGLVELATNTEVNTGTDSERVVTPSGLSSLPSWTNATYNTDWTNDGTALAYTKDNLQFVVMRGDARRTDPAASELITTLPAGYRPQVTSYFACPIYRYGTTNEFLNSLFATIQVGTDGTVRWRVDDLFTTDDYLIKLDSIRFSTQ